MCMTLGVAHNLVHCVSMVMEANLDWVCVKLDVRNAHNEISRACILETMDFEPSLRHITNHMATTLAMPSALESGGEVCVEVIDAKVGKELESEMDSYGEIRAIVVKEEARDKQVTHRYIKVVLL